MWPDQLQAAQSAAIAAGVSLAGMDCPHDFIAVTKPHVFGATTIGHDFLATSAAHIFEVSLCKTI